MFVAGCYVPVNGWLHDRRADKDAAQHHAEADEQRKAVESERAGIPRRSRHSV